MIAAFFLISLFSFDRNISSHHSTIGTSFLSALGGNKRGFKSLDFSKEFSVDVIAITSVSFSLVSVGSDFICVVSSFKI